jgi:hypothetical protein
VIDAITLANRQRIVDLAMKYRLPIFVETELAETVAILNRTALFMAPLPTQL